MIINFANGFFTFFQKDRIMQRGMLILWVFLAQVVSGQNIGAVLAEKQQEINTCFDRQFGTCCGESFL